MSFLRPRWVKLRLAIALTVGSGLAVARAESPPDAASPPPVSAASEPVDPLVLDVAEAIEITSRRYLQAGVHTPWQIMHGLLALRKDYIVKDPNGQKVRALDWISGGAAHRGEYWFEKSAYGGRAHPYTTSSAFEGHPNQFLAILTMSNLPPDHEIKVAGNQPITIADIVKHTQMEVNTREEITWALWGLSHYLDPDATWQNKWRQNWSLEYLVRAQTQDSLTNAACGGTHGLFALSYARNAYLRTGRPLTGVWLEADQKIKQYVETARTYQNSDGTFSSNYFRGSGYARDLETRLSTSGHTLEFLMVALPQQRLDEEWVRRGVSALARELIDHRRQPIECGAMYHALDGLVIYRDRKFPKTEEQPQTELAQVDADDVEEADDENKKGEQTDSAAKSGDAPVAEDSAIERSAAKPVGQPEAQKAE